MKYEGTCDHCGRDIGAGHDDTCRYSKKGRR